MLAFIHEAFLIEGLVYFKLDLTNIAR